MLGLLLSTAFVVAQVPHASPQGDADRINSVHEMATRHGWMTACHHFPPEDLHTVFARQMLASPPRAAAAHSYAACLIEMGHEREAITFLNGVLTEGTADSVAEAGFPSRHTALLLTDLGLAHMRLGQNSAARLRSAEALDLHFDSDNASRLAMLLQLDAGSALDGDPAAAFSLIQEARSLVARAIRETPAATVEHGRFLLQSAILEVTATRIDPRSVAPTAQEQAEQAIRILEAVAVADPTELNQALLMDAYANMASIMALQGDREAAAQHASKARGAAPSQRLHHVLDAMLAPIEGGAVAEGAQFEHGGRVALEEHRVVNIR